MELYNLIELRHEISIKSREAPNVIPKINIFEEDFYINNLNSYHGNICIKLLDDLFGENNYNMKIVQAVSPKEEGYNCVKVLLKNKLEFTKKELEKIRGVLLYIAEFLT